LYAKLLKPDTDDARKFAAFHLHKDQEGHG